MTTARSSPPDEQRPPLARLVELAVVVPVEVGNRLIEAVPAVADKLPAAAERVKREIVLARFLGKMAVDQGVRELRSRLTPAPPNVVDTTAPTPDDDTMNRPEAVAESVAQHRPVDAAGDDDVPEVASLALADYDHLSSAEIVGKLDGLDDAERAAIERYELAGRHRRTILGKLDQLRTVAS